MPRQGLDTGCAPVQPCEHRPLEIHAGTRPRIAPTWCILASCVDVTDLLRWRPGVPSCTI
jgi:hypothetical protein